MSARLDWRGDQVFARVMDAAREAIDETTKEAARDAQGSHWWAGRSGRLEGNVINEAAVRRGRRVVSGRFGSTKRQGFYGLILERRRPFLRLAADRTFSHLSARIRRKLG